MALCTEEIKIKNLLSNYDTLTLSQLEVLGSLKTGKKKQIISTLVTKSAIKIDYLNDGTEVYCNFFSTPSKKFALIGEVLKELTQGSKSPILWFQKQEYPFTAMAFISDKMFDIAVVELKGENAFNAVINRVIDLEQGSEKDDFMTAPAPRPNLLIIVEKLEQIEKIKVKHKNIIFACVDLKNNCVKFSK